MPNNRDPVWITRQTAMAVHGMQLAEHGGLPGLRDIGLLEAALGRPQQILHYEPEASLTKLASAYICGLIRNHPFLDGNKRTGFVLGAIFLGRNGSKLRSPQPETANVILEVAAGTWTEDQLTNWLGRWTG